MEEAAGRRTAGSTFSPRYLLDTMGTRAWMLVCPIVVVAALLRLWEIGSWPVFIDEDFYVWDIAGVAKLPLAEVIRSTYGGKGPLPFLVLAKLGLVTGDFLIAGRVVAACAGTASTILCFFLGRRLAGPYAGLLTAFLYATSPVAILHERMALMDGPLTALSLGAVLLGWQAIERRSWMWAALAWIPGILAVQCKVPAIATCLALLLIVPSYRGTMKSRLKFAFTVAAAPLASYLVMLASPFAAGLADQNAQLVGAPSVNMLLENLSNLLDSISSYLPAGLWLFVLAGAVLLLQDHSRRGLFILATILMWSLPWLIFSRFAPSRYYLPALPYVCALAGAALTRLPALSVMTRQSIRIIAVALCVLVPVLAGAAGVQMVTAHTTATLTKLDDWQYRSGWPSGYGYREAADFISGMAEPGSAVAYVIDSNHRVGAGFLRPLPPGVDSLGLQSLDATLAGKRAGILYVVVDDGLEKPGQRVSVVLARELRLSVIAYFPRPGSETGVYILSTRAGL